jgi:hypothetical protein
VTQSPLVSVFLFLALWIAVLSLYARYWRSTAAGREWREFNGRVDPAVRRFAVSLRWLFLIVLGVAIMLAAERFRRVFHAGEAPGDASGLAVALLVVSSYIIAIVLTTLLINFVWWLSPWMRRASDAAKVGLDAVSFGNSMRILTMQAVVVVPVCLAQIYLGAIMK